MCRSRRKHGLAYRDSAIAAAAQAIGCNRLFTEDTQDGQRIAGVTIIDPFR